VHEQRLADRGLDPSRVGAQVCLQRSGGKVGQSCDPGGQLDALAARLLAFQDRYTLTARPFDWRFTREGLHDLCRRIDARRGAAGPMAA